MEWLPMMRDRDILKACLNFDLVKTQNPNIDFSDLLHLTVYHSFSEFLQVILPHCKNVDYLNEGKHTPLHVCERSKTDGAVMAEMLLDAGANINSRDKKSWTPLLLATQRPVSPNNAVIEILLDRGADINIQPTSGRNLIMTAISFKGKDIKSRRLLSILIEKGIDVNHKLNKKTDPPLMLAVRHLDIEAVEMLLKAGADINAANIEGRTAFDYAKSIQYSEIRIPMLKILSEYI